MVGQTKIPLAQIISFSKATALTQLELLCVQSWLDQNNPVTIFSIQKIGNLPKGARNAIVDDTVGASQAEGLMRHGAQDLTEDFFKWRLLRDAPDAIYVSLDMLLMKPLQAVDQGLFVGASLGGLSAKVVGFPAGSPVLQSILDFTSDAYCVPQWYGTTYVARLAAASAAGTPVHAAEHPFGVWGDHALTEFTTNQQAVSAKAFFPLHREERHMLFSDRVVLDDRLPDAMGVCLHGAQESGTEFAADSFIGKQIAARNVAAPALISSQSNSLPEIASLWIGDRLSWLEQLCLKSFADKGHKTYLYSYQPIENLPAGVIAGDASKIFSADPMLRHARTGSPAIHADMWRLNLLAKTDQIWVDADMYCYRPFDLPGEHVYGWEKPGLVCNAVLGLPRKSETLLGLLDFFKDQYAIAPWLKPWQQRELQEKKDAGNPVHMTAQEWGFTGPASVTHFLQKTGEIEHAQTQDVFYPISFKHRNHMIRPRFKIEEELTSDCRGVHFWARRMKPRLEEAENNRPRAGSFMDGLLTLHDIDPDAALIPAKKYLPQPGEVTEEKPEAVNG